MGQNRLDLPNGAESTCLGRREDTAYRGFHPPEAVRFQTIKQEIRRIPILKLRLAVELLNKEAHHRDVVSFFSVLSSQAAKRKHRAELFCKQLCSQVLSDCS